MRSRPLVSAMMLAFTGNTVLAQGVASTTVRGAEFAAAVNVTQRNVKLEGRLFVPQSVERARGVIVFMTVGVFPDAYLGAAREAATASPSLAAQLGAAVLYVRVSNIVPPAGVVPAPEQVARNAGLGGSDALLSLLERLGDESGRGELRKAPLAFWGYSAVANFGTVFATLYPERTVAVVRYHSHLREMSIDETRLGRVPVLLLAGGSDRTAGVEDAQSLWSRGRASGAPWTLAVDSAAPHWDEASLQRANEVFIPWMASVFGQRVPSTGTELRVVDDTSGWLGDRRTATAAPRGVFAGAKNEAVWLPDAAAAQAWQLHTTPVK